MRAALTCVVLILARAGACAGPIEPPLPPPAPPHQAEMLPIYQERLDRLAELLGTLSYMGSVCGDKSGSDWRAKMADLLKAEGSTEAGARLAGHYNRGFQGYSLIYRTCTPAAQIVVARSLIEGEQLTRSLSQLFTAD